MAWDSTRKVPWKRILMFEGIYMGLFVAFILITRPEKMTSTVTSIVIAAVLTMFVLVALVKFGYQPNWLRSREEQAALRAEKMAARQDAKATKDGRTPPSEQRYQPAPTRRTSTGHTQHKRRTRATRKR